MTDISNRRDDFLIFENDNGELMLSIPIQNGEPSSPKILVDENRNAVLYRGNNNKLFIEGIHPEVLDKFLSIGEIIVGETEGNSEFKHVYVARVIKVDILPTINE